MRFSLLFETLAYIHAATGRSSRGFVGRHFRLEDIEVLPQPTRLPIIIGGMGKQRTPSIAGRFADEYNMFASNAEDLAARVEVMQSSAAEVGRDAGEVKISITSSAILGADEAEYRDALGAAASERDKAPDELEAMLAERRMIHGTYEQAAAIIDEYAGQGVGRIYVQHFAPLDEIDPDEVTRHFRGLNG